MTMRSAIACCVLMLACLSAVAADPLIGPNDTGGYRGPLRNGIYPATNLMKQWPEGGPKLLWKYDKLGAGWSTITIAGDTLYVVGGAPGKLFAFTLDGKLKWTQPYGREFQKRFDGTRSTVTVAKGIAVVCSGVGAIYGMDAATGEIRWSVDTVEAFKQQIPGWGNNITPLVVDDKVIASIRRGTATMVALDLQTGKTIWANEPSTWAIGNSSPVLVDTGKQRIVVNNLWSAIIGVDPDNGKVIWKIERPNKCGTTITPVWAEGKLLVDLDGSMRMFRPTGDERVFEEIWTAPRFNDLTQAVTLAGKVFGVCGVPKQVTTTRQVRGKVETRTEQRKVLSLVALDADTGKMLHSEPVAKDGSICAADGMVYLLEGGEGAWQAGQPAKTRISLIKPTQEGFEIVSRFDPLLGSKEAWVNPVPAAGMLIIRHGSLIAAYDIAAK